jgi:rhamnose utilization protein RhaD (predicted bifunctional aldolase and dehydrogenase)
VLLLQNHGVVVGAETASAAEALLNEVELRLALPARTWPSHDADAITALADSQFEPHSTASGLALDAAAMEVLTHHTLVPDQVVFLGGAAPVLAPGEEAFAAALALKARTKVSPVLMIAPGLGLLVARDRSPGADSLIEGLIEITRRIPAGAVVNALPDEAVATLLGWEAEHYRQALDAARQRKA